MKKKMYCIAAGIFLLAMLAGCGSKEASVGTAESTEHVHVAEAGWDRNAAEHWQVCQCGEKLDVQEHTLDETVRCPVCESDVWVYEDGWADVMNYDAYGNLLRSSAYEGDTLLSEMMAEYEYDADGNMLSEKQYYDGVLSSENTYQMNGEGEFVYLRSVFYNDDRSYFVNEYDQNGNITYVCEIDVSGAVINESKMEYALDANGCYYQVKLEDILEDGTIYTSTYDDHGENISRVKIDAEGNVVFEEAYEREYDEAGNMLWEKTYRNGMLANEIVSYAEVTTEDYWCRYPEQIIEYYEDGTRLVSEYGNNTMVAKEIFYNADGSVGYENIYVYETFEDGNWSRIQILKDGKLSVDQEYAVSEDGWSYKVKETEYFEDSSYSVTEFNEWDEVLSVTMYDASGNVKE